MEFLSLMERSIVLDLIMDISFQILLFILALVFGNFLEWFVHKYILHGLGRNKKSFWSFHYHTHHRLVIKSKGYDENYHQSIFKNKPKQKEVLAIFAGVVLLLPAILVVPGFVLGAIIHGTVYYLMHKRSHTHPEWGWKYMPWHMQHHFGNSEKNWCVIFPLFDWMLKTRDDKPKNH